MLGQYLAGELFDLAERHGLETAGALQAKAKAANACEKIEGAQLGHNAATKCSAK